MPASNLNATPNPGYSRISLIIAASVSSLGGFLFGYDNIVISGAIGYLSLLFHLDEIGVGWAAACALVGCIFGCMAAGSVADYLGKKKGLGLCALCFALSSVGMLFANNLHQFVVWRLIGGVGIGAASVIAPNYIAEIAPTRLRGRCREPQVVDEGWTAEKSCRRPHQNEWHENSGARSPGDRSFAQH